LDQQTKTAGAMSVSPGLEILWAEGWQIRYDRGV